MRQNLNNIIYTKQNFTYKKENKHPCGRTDQALVYILIEEHYNF